MNLQNRLAKNVMQTRICQKLGRPQRPIVLNVHRKNQLEQTKATLRKRHVYVKKRNITKTAMGCAIVVQQVPTAAVEMELLFLKRLLYQDTGDHVQREKSFHRAPPVILHWTAKL